MPNINFGPDGKAVFPTKYHGSVRLSQTKWEMICSAPERVYYRFNGEKIATTLINPDSVRRHQSEKNQYFYYKRFSSIMMDERLAINRPSGVYFAVIIDDETKRVCTAYPVNTPKPGKAFRPTSS
jgi:hypothetical protein